MLMEQGTSLALSNLALLTGNIGMPFGRHQPPSGVRIMCRAPVTWGPARSLPGYQGLDDPEALEKFSRAWDSEIPDYGKILPEIFEDAAGGRIKAMYIMGENPLLSEPT